MNVRSAAVCATAWPCMCGCVCVAVAVAMAVAVAVAVAMTVAMAVAMAMAVRVVCGSAVVAAGCVTCTTNERCVVTDPNVECIMLDIVMKMSNGVDVCRNLRAQGYTLPILAVTGTTACQACFCLPGWVCR